MSVALASAAILLDPATGYGIIADHRFPLAFAGTGGELQLNGEHGPVLRPLRFGERSRLVWQATSTARPHSSVIASIAQCAEVRAGEANLAIQQIVALVLAGAELEAPPFTETTLLISQRAGADLRQLAVLDAAEVDRLALCLVAEPSESEWNTLMFGQRVSSDLDTIRDELAERLLRRGRIRPDVPAAPARRSSNVEPPTTDASVSTLAPSPMDALKPTTAEHAWFSYRAASQQLMPNVETHISQEPVVRWRVRPPANASSITHEAPQGVDDVAVLDPGFSASHLEFQRSHDWDDLIVKGETSSAGNGDFEARFDAFRAPFVSSQPTMSPEPTARVPVGVLDTPNTVSALPTIMSDLHDLADALALSIDDEATLRGVLP